MVLVAKRKEYDGWNVIGETPTERKGKGRRGDDIRIPNFGTRVR